MLTHAARSQTGTGPAGDKVPAGRAGPAGRSSGGAAAGPSSSLSTPLTVIVGEEDLLVERAVAAVLPHGAAAADGSESAPDVHDVRGADLTAGELSLLTAPSLFGGECVVVIRAAQDANAAVAAEIGQLAASMPEEVTLVVTHVGGAKGKALLAALGKAGATRIDCPSIRRFGERMDFLRAELARAGRKADDRGLRALIDAVA